MKSSVCFILRARLRARAQSSRVLSDHRAGNTASNGEGDLEVERSEAGRQSDEL